MTIPNPRCSRSLFPALEQHRDSWNNCQGCILHETAKQKVFYRGDLPCDILFVGDVPGPAEDDLGVPFIGPMAPIFNTILERSLTALLPRKLKYAITNAVLCKPPIKENTVESPREPDKEELKACSSRLASFLALGSPKLVVGVGKVADKALLQAFMSNDIYYRTLSINHPGFIERSDDKQREIERAVLQLTQALQRIFGEGK